MSAAVCASHTAPIAVFVPCTPTSGLSFVSSRSSAAKIIDRSFLRNFSIHQVARFPTIAARFVEAAWPGADGLQQETIDPCPCFP
jgi:hypothetical protein